MKTKYTIFLLTFFLLWGACNKDDLEDCPIMLHVYFESIMSKYSYENITDQLDLYLYDQSEALVEKFSYSRSELQQNGYTPVLPIWNFGDYTLVALVNEQGNYSVSGTDNLQTLNVAIKTQNGDTIKKKPTELFQAHKQLSLPFTGVINRYDTLSLYKNTNHINIKLLFESNQLPENTVIYPYIQGNNGSFDYSNKCLPNSKRVYQPHTTNTDNYEPYILLGFTTMQLWIGSDLTLFIEEEVDNKRILRNQLNIVDHISKVPKYDTNEKLDQEDIFNIELVLKSNFTILELKINDWYTVRGGVEI